MRTSLRLALAGILFMSALSPARAQTRIPWLQDLREAQQIANKYRDKLKALYGTEKGSKIKYAEAFEDSEYGTRLNKNNIRVLFPFFEK